MTFKYILLIISGIFTFYVLLLPQQDLLRKLLFLSVVFVVILFALKPEWSTLIAHYFGIGRGVDFLFYISHLTLLFIVFVYYLKFKALEIKLTRLVRKVAIAQVNSRGENRINQKKIDPV